MIIFAFVMSIYWILFLVALAVSAVGFKKHSWLRG